MFAFVAAYGTLSVCVCILAAYGTLSVCVCILAAYGTLSVCVCISAACGTLCLYKHSFTSDVAAQCVQDFRVTLKLLSLICAPSPVVMVKQLMQLKTIPSANATTDFALMTKGIWFKPGPIANDKIAEFFSKWTKKCNSPPAEEIVFCLEGGVAFKFLPVSRVALGSDDDARTGMTLKRSLPVPVI